MEPRTKNAILDNPKAPPIIFAVGSALWKLVAAWSNVDFILSVREEKFGLMFQFLLDYGWGILIGVGILWVLQVHKAPEDASRVHWGMVFSVGTLCFIFGVLATAYATGSIPQIIVMYGSDGKNCTAEFDTSRLSSFRDKYNILLVCGLNDPTVDRFEDQRIALSSPFGISPAAVTITTPYGRIQEAINALVQSNLPPGAVLVQPALPSSPSVAQKPSSTQSPKTVMQQRVEISMWHTPILMPKDADLSEIKRLSDVPKHGGKILEKGYF
jgi:hypothetical protein